MSEKNYSILLIEDSESVLIALKDYLIQYFEVISSRSLAEAEEQLLSRKDRKPPFNLVISDIYLSGGSVLHLIKEWKLKQPSMKYILITAYEINDYIDFIHEEGISNVISKHSNLCLKYLYITAKKILSNKIFGVNKYFEDIKVHYPSEMPTDVVLKNRSLYSVMIRSTDDRITWMDKIAKDLEKAKNVPGAHIRMLLDEMTTNAMLRAPRTENGDYKFQKKDQENDRLIQLDDIILDEEDYFLLEYGYYDDYIILVCQDHHGTLLRREVLYRLKRHIEVSPKTGFPSGITDYHGRGFFLLREQLDNLIINIEKDKKTEVICIHNNRRDSPYKNISIFEAG